MQAKLRSRNRCLIASYAIISVLALLPVLGIAFNSSTLIAGIPLPVVWLTACFGSHVVLCCVGYITVFRHWAAEIDSTATGDASDSKGAE